MNYVLRMSVLFAFAIVCLASSNVVAQKKKTKTDEKVQLNEQMIEQWAEKHAEAWEKWAEKFEYKMERWAADQEKHWEKWADEYSQRWENWGSKLESGDLDPEELQTLMEHNLKMLKDMPLDSMIKGALKEGLGELKNAPIESLGELHELVGGSLEQSLRAMEKELAAVNEMEIKGKLENLKTKDLHEALKKLQGAIEMKQKKHGADAAATITRLEEMLKKSRDLGSKQKDEILEALHRELADAAIAEKMRKEDMAAQRLKEAMSSRREMAKALEEKAKAEHAREMAIAAEKMAREKQKLSDDLAAEKKSLEQYYQALKKQKAELESKESDIDVLRREIMELRKEVDRMKKQAGKENN